MRKLILSILALTAGCAPKGGTVANNPPRIEPLAAQFSLHYGSFQPDFMSGLLWPMDWSESDYEKNVKAINNDGKELIARIIETEKKPSLQINALWRKFREGKCIEQFAADGTSNDPTQYHENDDVTFKPDAPAECVQDQAMRKALHAQIDQALQAEGDPTKPGPLSLLQYDIATKLGKGRDLFSGTDASASGFKFTVGADGVPANKIFFGNFEGSGKSVSSTSKNPATQIQNVQLSASGDELSFVIPDVADPTMAYAFQLVRVAPLYTFDEYQDDGTLVPTEEAVYKGDIGVLKNGKLVGAGSASIIGKFVGAAN